MKVFYNDIDKFCCGVLRKNIADGNLYAGDVSDKDIREIHGRDLAEYKQIHLFAGIGGFPLGFRWAGMPDDFSILTGGFPCQDISDAGRRLGISGPRSGLRSEMHRLICQIRPKFVVVENVSALRKRGIARVLGDLAIDGYDAQWGSLRARDFGPPHRRERIFIVAYTRRFVWTEGVVGNNCETKSGGDKEKKERGNYRFFATLRTETIAALQAGFPSEPALARMADGVPNRVDRITALGNAIVPQIAAYIGGRILEFDRLVGGIINAQKND